MGNSSNNPLSGVLVVDKPEGITSFAVIRRVRKALHIKKVGHTGTLDPMATGVLPICLGRATKLVPFLQAGDKEYEGRMLLGVKTDTYDITGEVIAKETDFILDRETVEKVALEFVGEIMQAPPVYSALKINGQPAYKLARQGKEVRLKQRNITIHSLDVLDVDLPSVSFKTRVSKGAYIRSLVVDWGDRLGPGACLQSLRRTVGAPFHIDDAVKLEEIEELARQDRIRERLISLSQALSFMPELEVSPDVSKKAANGQTLPLSCFKDFTPAPGPVRLQDQDKGLVAIYEYNPPSENDFECLTPLRVLCG